MQWSSLNDKQKSYILAFGLAVVNFLVFLLSPLGDFTFENQKVSLWMAILSAILFVGHIILCIVCRFKKKLWIARGIFLYQLVGGIAYVIFFVTFIASSAGASITQSALDVFRWWTLWYEPFTVTLCRFIGIPLKFVMGILYLILIDLSGSTVTAIRKDIRYEKQREEDRRYEEATKGRGGHW